MLFVKRKEISESSHARVASIKSQQEEWLSDWKGKVMMMGSEKMKKMPKWTGKDKIYQISMYQENVGCSFLHSLIKLQLFLNVQIWFCCSKWFQMILDLCCMIKMGIRDCLKWNQFCYIVPLLITYVIPFTIVHTEFNSTFPHINFCL